VSCHWSFVLGRWSSAVGDNRSLIVLDLLAELSDRKEIPFQQRGGGNDPRNQSAVECMKQLESLCSRPGFTFQL